MRGLSVMGRLALPHHGYTKVLPPRDLLEPFIERTEGHWYWLGEFYENALDRSAEFVWAAPAEYAGHYMVPRLLWQLAQGDALPKRVMLENTCGLFTCINPGHWRDRRNLVVMPARIVLSESVQAMPVMHPGLHLTVHIRRHNTEATVCGSGYAARGMDKKTVITCDDCISTWVRTKQPFTEVP